MKYFKKGQYIDRGQNVDYNVDRCTHDSIEPKFIGTVKTKDGLKIEIWDDDFQHALEGHPGKGIGKLETAYETTLIKSGTTLYDREKAK